MLRTIFLFVWGIGFMNNYWGQGLEIQDGFGRNISADSVRMVDWEGEIANPAIKISLIPNASATFPIDVQLTADHPRLYFNMPSQTGVNGPSKNLQIVSANPVDVYLSVFPDPDSLDELHTLAIVYTESGKSPVTTKKVITVRDEDRPGREITYQISTDFSKDTKNFFLNDSLKQAIVRQAADDWAYYLADPGLDPVAVGDEQSFIWNDDWASGTWVSNSFAYQGFLLYAYGQDNSEARSGGGASNHAFQKVNGIEIPLRRSGGYHAEPDGNFNELGWNTTITADSWFASRNLSGEAHDLYSIALHEIGHALGYHAFAYPDFETFSLAGFIDDLRLIDYHGSVVPINSSAHMNPGGSGFVVDRISKKGAFGSEYAAEMPLGRWLITKLSLLGLQAIGHTLRETSPFLPLAMKDSVLMDGVLNENYQDSWQAKGGLAIYDWQIASGSLPAGLGLNRFTGQISGIPTETGVFPLDVDVRDYDGAVHSFSTTLTINESVAIDEGLKRFPFKVYPNPAENSFWIEMDFPHSGDIKLVLLDLIGRPLRSIPLIQKKQMVDISDLPIGKYFLRFSNGREVFFTTLSHRQ